MEGYPVLYAPVLILVAAQKRRWGRGRSIARGADEGRRGEVREEEG